MKFKTLTILTSILLLSFLAFIFFTLRSVKGPDPYQVFSDNKEQFEKLAPLVLNQDELYSITKVGFDQGRIRISPRTGKSFDISLSTFGNIDPVIYDQLNFNAYCTEYKFKQDFIKEIINLILDTDIFFIKKNFRDSTVSFGINYEERIIFKPNGVTEFEKKRYKLLKDNWYYLKESM